MKIKEILDFLQTARIPFSFTGDPEREVDRFSSLSHYRGPSPGSKSRRTSRWEWI